MRILGAVLAGGRSRRFGSDKAEAVLDGRRLVDHAADSLAPFCERIAVIGRIDPRHVSVPDLPAAGLGPLGGLCGALDYANRHGFGAVLVTACDMPTLPPALVEALIDGMAAVAEDVPVTGCWPSTFAEPLLHWLEAGEERSVNAWAAHAAARRIAWPEPIRNINRPEDMTA